MRVTIIRAVSAAPDHIRTRVYQAGEQHLVDSPLMPKGLADLLVDGGAFEQRQVKSSVGAVLNVAKVEVPAATMDDKPLDVEWLKPVAWDKDGNGKTKHDVMFEELFGKHAVVLPW